MFRFKSLIAITLLMLISFASVVSAESIVLFATGNGSLGQPDPFITVNRETSPPIIVPPVSFGNTTIDWGTQTGAQWVTPVASAGAAANAPTGNYVYTFPLSVLPNPFNPGGPPPNESELKFSFFADNKVNGISLTTNSGQVFPVDFSVPGNPDLGQNNLGTGRFRVSNVLLPGVTAAVTVENVSPATFNPTGLNLRVEQVLIPEPSTLLLLASGLGGLAVLRRRASPSEAKWR